MTLDLQTARLHIRAFEQEDWRTVHEYLSKSGMRDFVPEWPETAEETQVFVGRKLDGEARQHALALRDGGRLIGHVGFHPWFGPETYEIGWAVAPEHQGRGFATEAAFALLAHGFDTLALHRIVATCQPENTASVRVMGEARPPARGALSEVHTRSGWRLVG